ncbi:hypothetical protein ACEQ8H_008095 [Pleosporales sp. CAS-2024a]
MAPNNQRPVVLFGYDSYVRVPSMLPRPLITTLFALPYRKIPILAIGRHIYCDTCLIVRALEHFFPANASTPYNTIFPVIPGHEAWSYAPLAQGFTTFWADKPLFRVTTGLIPQRVWETQFGVDRAQLIGHKLDAKKLGNKVAGNMEALDGHLSVLEALFQRRDGDAEGGKWIFPTKTPGLADVGLWYQIKWGIDIANGRGVEDLSGGGTVDGGGQEDEVTRRVWNEGRYPGLWKWFHDFESHINGLQSLQAGNDDKQSWLAGIEDSVFLQDKELLIPTTAKNVASIPGRLLPGADVTIAPDDTGRENPTVGTLLRIGAEELVIRTAERGQVDVVVHFPTLGFVVKATSRTRL